ncbi:MAG TPA: galactosyldiacylglycerol synthase, partial [Solibacterales bacterium]|nr:galactosyldiacylglycerol synthase [Bryobacterales bacterium]
MKKADFIYFDAGGGHRAAATALSEVIARQDLPWNVRLVNLQDLLDELDIVRKLTGIRVQDVYNNLLKAGFTLGSAQLLKVLHLLVRFYHGGGVRLLRNYWQPDPPDLVVSLIPNLNRALFDGLRQASPRTPLVTILTDIADYPPHFWIEAQPQYFICGSDKAVAQARALGHGADRVYRASGMILSPRFYEPVAKDRAAERERLGLHPSKPTGLVLFGGQGSSAMREILDRLDRSPLDVQLILICGRNEALQRELAQRRTRIPKFVEGFTREVPYYMHLADFFIGKPGPGSISEALAKHLPVIVPKNAWTLPQERYNADWVAQSQLGLVVPDFHAIEQAVARLLDPPTFARFRANAQGIENRAVFEIP